MTLLVLLLDHLSCLEVLSALLETQDCTEEHTLDQNPESTQKEVGSKGDQQSSLFFPLGSGSFNSCLSLLRLL